MKVTALSNASTSNFRSLLQLSARLKNCRRFARLPLMNREQLKLYFLKQIAENEFYPIRVDVVGFRVDDAVFTDFAQSTGVQFGV